jgi:hypothetical protein
MADHSATTNKCPICKKAAEEDCRPFCSKRCANTDLFNWLNGSYALPGEPVPFEEENDPFDESPQGDRAI